MKKSFLLALLLLIGCQKTPEQPLIVPKDQELMLKEIDIQKEIEPVLSLSEKASLLSIISQYLE